MWKINLKPKDIIAICVVLLIFALILLKSNHSLDSILALILGYYFAHRQDKIDPGI